MAKKPKINQRERLSTLPPAAFAYTPLKHGVRLEAGVSACGQFDEETGAIDYDIVPVWDYQAFKEDGTFVYNGRYYFVNIREFAHIPDGSEMNKIDFFDVFPENFRYPDNSEEIFENFKRAEKYALAYYK